MIEEKKKEEGIKEEISWGSVTYLSGNVKSINNDIYFFSEISQKTILHLTEQIHLVTKDMQIIGVNLGIEPPLIRLHIKSFGGGIFAGFAGYDIIKNNPVKINTIIEGCAASAGTILSLGGDERLIRSNAYMLIHQLSSVAWGKYEELKDQLQNWDKMMETIKNIYLKHTKILKNELEEILKHDWWLTAEESLKYGLVDKIL